MKRRSHVLLVSCCLGVLAAILSASGVDASRRSDYREEGDLIVLNEGNFFPAVHHDFKRILVFFHSPTCGICRGFMRDFRKAAELLKEMKSDIVMAAVNVDKERTLMRALQFPGVPVVKYYIDGRALRYTGGRGAQNIIDWMYKQHSHAKDDVIKPGSNPSKRGYDAIEEGAELESDENDLK